MPVVWQLHEVYYLVIWMCGEASAILVAVAADFFFDGSHLKKKSAATALNTVLASGHIQMP
jgi:hypothetical protein